MVLSLMPLAFYGATWWTVLSLFGPTALIYVGSVNLANTVGDAIGHRWGRSTLRRRWEAFVRAREGR